MGTISRREQLKIEKKEKILAAARKVFAEKGFQAASISDLLREAQLARGTFYLYFKDKNDVIAAILQEAFVMISGTVETLDVKSLSHRELFYSKLEEMARSLFRNLEKNRDILQILITNQTGNDSEAARQIEAFFDILYQLTVSMVKKGIEAGHLIDHDADLLGHIIVGSMREVVYQWLVRERIDDPLEERISQIVHFFMKGVEKR